jgi:large subunit ribosomal protein L10
MKTKSQKQEVIDSLAKALPETNITIFTTFAREGEAGLSVTQLEELKATLRQVEGEYIVAKKRLVEKILGGLKYDGIDVFSMDGSVGLVLGRGDAYAVAKALYQFAKSNPSLKLFSGWMDGHVLSYDEVMELGTMPSREELIARLLGMLNYPLRSLAIVLNQISESKPAEPEAPTEKSAEEAPTQESIPATAEAPASEPVSAEATDGQVATPNEENNG